MIDYDFDESIQIGTERHGLKRVQPQEVYSNEDRAHEHRWQFREYARCLTGVYKRLPKVVRDRLVEELTPAQYDACKQIHFPHMSDKQPGLIAYTESRDKGERDIQTATKIGRFLTRVLCVTDQAVIKSISQSMTLATGHEQSDAKVQFTSDPSEIAHLYMNGPESCMDKCRGHWNTNGVHPVEAYHPEDWALAYIPDDDGGCIARTMVTREQKYIRTYPDGCNGNELAAVLQEMGYRHDSGGGEGMRLRRIEVGSSGFVGPYVDGDDMDVYDDGEALWIGVCPPCAHHVGTSQESYDTEGLINGGNRAECAECGEHFNPDNENMTGVDSWGETMVCESCIDQYFVYSNHHDRWLRADDCVYVDSIGDHVDADETVCSHDGNEYILSCEAVELHDGGYIHEDDGELVELADGRFALEQDTVDTIDAGLQLMEECIENSDGDFVLHNDEDDQQLAMTGV